MEIENIWIAILVVIALALLGYLVGLLSSKFDLRPRVERRFLLPESEEEARARYRAAWRKYRRVRVAFPLTFVGWLPFGFALSAIFRLFGWDWHIASIIMLAWIPFISIFSWQWVFWQCPRCGKAFKWSGDLFFPKYCHYCKLPMWAESPDA